MGREEGLKIGVVDERSEIAACHRGVPQNDLGPRVDVLTTVPGAGDADAAAVHGMENW